MSTELQQPSDARVSELTDALAQVRSRVEAATTKRSSDTSSPCLVAVSKLKPASDILACCNLGQLDFGENYVNEMVDKASQLPEDIRWHFIGNLQSNKCKAVAGVPNLYCLHTLDSIKKADGLQKALPATRKQPLNVMIQINTSGEDSKSGLPPLSSSEAVEASEVVALARHVISSCPALRLYGVMTIGSFEASTSSDGPNPDFLSLISTRDTLQDILNKEAELKDKWGMEGRLALSMGMSADFEEAIIAGSDLVRTFTSKPSNMEVVEAVHVNGATTTVQHQLSISKPEGRDYDEDYDNDNLAGPTVGVDEMGTEDEEDYGEDYDPEAEAEAIVRAMGNQIWAELEQSIPSKNGVIFDENIHGVPDASESQSPKVLQADSDPSNSEPVQTSFTLDELPVNHPPHSESSPSLPPETGPPLILDPMIETIKTMLSLALSDPHVHYALVTTIVPGPVANGANLYTVLNQSVIEGRVNPELAQPLSILISALASGSMMIAAESSQPYSQPSPPQPTEPSPLKRKRENTDEGQSWPPHTVYNPAVHPVHPPQPPRTQQSEELLARLQSASSDIVHALEPLLTNGEPLNQSAVVPIQRQLHQVYAFVSTCPQPKPEGTTVDNALQEIGGLIQLVGILSGVPIAQSIDGITHIDSSPPTDLNRSGQSSRSSNNSIGTVVYPCSICPRVFGKLSAVRAHERTHSEGRPYRCEYAGCPASFARNHDLRRHEKSHERQMFRCRGCDKLFSRRDALRRHKTNEKAPEECRGAPIDTSTVQHDGEPPRVTRVWQNHPEGGDWPRDSEVEDGEIQSDVLVNARYIVGTIHAILQGHVTRGLHTEEPTSSSQEQPPENGAPPGQPASEQPDPAAGIILNEPSTRPDQTGHTTDDLQVSTPTAPPEESPNSKAAMTLPGYGLDDEHADMLERAIAVAAEAARAQAEAEAAMYEESYEDEQIDGDWDEEDENGHVLKSEAEVNKLVC
ncbi:C2H2 zinc finger [Ceratobasidium sp. AG-Ba]|nr:C2H2 zinc finger [Ceratobasidium sp. AG-Ba]